DIQAQRVMIGHRVGNNWVIDASVSKTLIAGTDYTLGVSLRGSTASVTLDDQAMTGFVYNGVAIDGRFGVFAKGGSTGFDTMTVKTNDALSSQSSSSLINWEASSNSSVQPTGALDWHMELEPVV